VRVKTIQNGPSYQAEQKPPIFLVACRRLDTPAPARAIATIQRLVAPSLASRWNRRMDQADPPAPSQFSLDRRKALHRYHKLRRYQPKLCAESTTVIHM